MHQLDTEKGTEKTKVICPKLLKVMAKVMEEMRNLDSHSPAFLHHSKEKLFLSAKLLRKR